MSDWNRPQVGVVLLWMSEGVRRRPGIDRLEMI